MLKRISDSRSKAVRVKPAPIMSDLALLQRGTDVLVRKAILKATRPLLVGDARIEPDLPFECYGVMLAGTWKFFVVVDPTYGWVYVECQSAEALLEHVFDGFTSVRISVADFINARKEKEND